MAFDQDHRPRYVGALQISLIKFYGSLYGLYKTRAAGFTVSGQRLGLALRKVSRFDFFALMFLCTLLKVEFFWAFVRNRL